MNLSSSPPAAEGGGRVGAGGPWGGGGGGGFWVGFVGFVGLVGSRLGPRSSVSCSASCWFSRTLAGNEGKFLKALKGPNVVTSGLIEGSSNIFFSSRAFCFSASSFLFCSSRSFFFFSR